MLTIALLVDCHFLRPCTSQITFHHSWGEKPALWLCMGPPVSASLNSKHLTGDYEHKEKVKSVI